MAALEFLPVQDFHPRPAAARKMRGARGEDGRGSMGKAGKRIHAAVRGVVP